MFIEPTTNTVEFCLDLQPTTLSTWFLQTQGRFSLSSPSMAPGNSWDSSAEYCIEPAPQSEVSYRFVTSQRPYKATIHSGSFCFADLFVSLNSLSNDVSFFSFCLLRLDAMALGSPVSAKKVDSPSNKKRAREGSTKWLNSFAPASRFLNFFAVAHISVRCGFLDRQLLSQALSTHVQNLSPRLSPFSLLEMWKFR